MTRRNYSDDWDPELTREDMGRPTRAEAEADNWATTTVPDPCYCGKCLACAVRDRAWRGGFGPNA